MKKQETYAVRFVVRKSKVIQNEKSPLSVRVTVNAQRVEISLGWFVTESIWDEKMQKCKGSTREAKGTNGFIDATTFRLTDIRQRLLIEGKEVSADFIKARYKGLPDPDEIPNPTIIELYNEHNKKFHELIGTNKHSNSTYNRHLTSRAHLEKFIQKVYGKSDLSFEFVDFKFLNDNEHYLKSVRKCNHNSTMKYIKNAGKIINQAFAEGFLERNPFGKFKLSYETVKRDPLSEKEIQRIVDLDVDERLDRVRDCFLFSIYSGIPFGDLETLTMDDIHDDKEGNLWISKSRNKTEVEFITPILPIPLKLIKKYETHPKRKIQNLVLPVVTNQRYNAYLKEIATLAKIKKNLTTHLARHTFATTVTLDHGIPIEIVSKMLGHRDIKTTQIYAQVQQKAILFSMKKLMDKSEHDDDTNIVDEKKGGEK